MSCLLYDIICDIDDLASYCINSFVRQKVFCNFELAALLLLNTIYIYLPYNEILRYLVVVIW